MDSAEYYEFLQKDHLLFGELAKEPN